MTPAEVRIRRAQSLGGKIGAARRLASILAGRVKGPTADNAKKARRAYALSFGVAHGGLPDAPEFRGLGKRLRPVGLCRVCPDRIEVPEGVSEGQRAEFAAVMRSAHFLALAQLAVAARRRAG